MLGKLWRAATQAEEGQEAEAWPEEWRVGIMVPLWKKKRPKENRNNWRGITLLSVGSKLLARVVAERASSWASGFLDVRQSGFTRGRGTDDTLQMSRRVAEEISLATNERRCILRFYDLEKAYPKTSRKALWKLMLRRGPDPGFIKVCRALHDHAKIQDKI